MLTEAQYNSNEVSKLLQVSITWIIESVTLSIDIQN